MAFINLILLNKEKMHIQKVSHHFILRLLNKKLENIKYVIPTLETTYHRDAGYCIIDVNQKILFSNQTAFSTSHITSEARQYLWKNWNVIEEL